ncbi:MAG: thioredoxin family protein [Hyphomicrobiaceae bacterium]|nr:thioredoxin family protein [Hyphomicrobiaceae bacterium]
MFLRTVSASLIRMSIALLLLLASGMSPPGPLTAQAAFDETAGPAPSRDQLDANLQIVVLEAPGCTYCTLFRRYVLPAYATSPRSRDVPIKFLDLNDEAYDKLGLDGPVDMVPTAVLMQNNREVGRIAGYLGPENFFHAMNHLLARVN